MIDDEPLAAQLIAKTGSFEAVLALSTERLTELAGSAAAFAIQAFRSATTHLLQRRVEQRLQLGDWQALLDYIHADMAHLTRERLRVLYLNSANCLLLDEIAAEGTINEVSVHVREIVRRALDVGAVALLLVHNHPSGDHRPSRADILLTRSLHDAGQRLGVIVHDHLVVSEGGHTSLRTAGLFKP